MKLILNKTKVENEEITVGSKYPINGVFHIVTDIVEKPNFYEVTVEDEGGETEEITDEISKAQQLENIVVTTSTGKKFYGNAEARNDINNAITLGQANGINETPWKLAEAIDGKRVVIVTIQELVEALYLALQEKGKIVGAL